MHPAVVLFIKAALRIGLALAGHRPVVEIPNADEVFHVLYDIKEHPQIPGMYSVLRGVTYEQDGYTPHWRGVADQKQVESLKSKAYTAGVQDLVKLYAEPASITLQ